MWTLRRGGGGEGESDLNVQWTLTGALENLCRRPPKQHKSHTLSSCTYLHRITLLVYKGMGDGEGDSNMTI